MLLSLFKKRIDDIPTEAFNIIIDDLIRAGWKTKSQYKGFDAWIDYGKVELTKSGSVLIFEWDNWTEGVVKGYGEIIDQIAKQYNLNPPSKVLF
ncbi:MAG: hypothetical protein VYD53_18180 [Pseudomonadota bacterium]|nr:hypothetical protein [Pseudomonadota bacterium]